MILVDVQFFIYVFVWRSCGGAHQRNDPNQSVLGIVVSTVDCTVTTVNKTRFSLPNGFTIGFIRLTAICLKT